MVWSREKMSVLAGGLGYNATSPTPNLVAEGEVVAGSIKNDSPAAVHLEVHLTLDWAAQQVGLRFSEFVDKKVVIITAGN